MKKLLILPIILISSCSTVKPIEEKKEKKITVRLTVYNKNEDRFTKRGLSSSGMPLIDRKTVAVDPAIFPYGSEIKLPEMGLSVVATDTGTDVKSRKASRKLGFDYPVIDLYFDRKRDADYFSKNNSMFTEAVIN